MMRRNACLLWAWIALVPLFAGCSLFQKKEPMTDVNASGSVDAYDPAADPYTSTGGYGNYGGAYGSSYGGETAGGAATASTRSADPYAAETTSYDSSSAGYSAGGSRYHTVQRKDTLYNLARQYYNDEKSWKKIYQANSDVIHNPNQIYPGQKLLIP